MRPDHGCESAATALLADGRISLVLRQTLTAFRRSVTIRDLVAKHPAATHGSDPIFERCKTAIDGIGGRLVIDERRSAAAKGGQRADSTAHLDAFRRMCAIEPPPNKLQDFIEVARLPRWCGHAGRKR